MPKGTFSPPEPPAPEPGTKGGLLHTEGKEPPMQQSTYFCDACRQSAHILTVTVSEVFENAFLAQVEEENGAFAAGDALYVTAETLPALQAGDRAEVMFNGLVMPSLPARIAAELVAVIETAAKNGAESEPEETAEQPEMQG